jgi:hypothetical protein
MERRRAIAISAATVATTLGAAAAIAANFGLLGFGQAGSSPLGRLDAGRPAVATAPAGSGAAVRYEDIFLPAPLAPAIAPPHSVPAAAADPGPATAVGGEPGEVDAARQAPDDEDPAGHESDDDATARHDAEDD